MLLHTASSLSNCQYRFVGYIMQCTCTYKAKTALLQATEALVGRGHIAPTHSRPRHWMGWVVSVTPRPCFSPDHRYPLCRRLGGPQSRSGHRGYRKNPLPLSGIEPRSSSTCTYRPTLSSIISYWSLKSVNVCSWVITSFLWHDKGWLRRLFPVHCSSIPTVLPHLRIGTKVSLHTSQSLVWCNCAFQDYSLTQWVSVLCVVD
jgi:hypothetical protein